MEENDASAVAFQREFASYHTLKGLVGDVLTEGS